MKTWNHLPEPHHHNHDFTGLQLPEESIRSQLESLGRIQEPELAEDLKLLRNEARDDPTRTSLRLRRDQKNLSDGLKTAFKDAVEATVNDNAAYTRLVLVHADMSHNMHGSMGEIGLLRFLGWHRQYLMVFEELIIAADRALRPNANERVSLPFWRWEDPFPDWLNGFLPAKHPATGASVPARRNSQPPEKPEAADVAYVLENFRTQLKNVQFSDPNVADYVRFTFALEGWGERPDGSDLPAHNHVHDWVGGIMANTSYSPTDPIFWLHHAEVDRLWSIWQTRFPNAHPPLSGADRIFGPWNATYDTVKTVEGMNYTYEPV